TQRHHALALEPRDVVVGAAGLAEDLRRVLAEERPATPMPDRGAFEAQRRAEPADGAEARVRQIHEELAGDEMRVAEHVAVIGDLAARHPRRSQGGEPVRSRFCSGDRLDRGDERIAVVPAQRRVRVARIAIDTPTFTGGPPSSPVTLMSPLCAWTMMSSAGRSAFGPSRPHPVTATYTRRGSLFKRSRGARPRSFIVPGRRFSTTTSADRTRSENSFRPASRLRSIATERLSRL